MWYRHAQILFIVIIGVAGDFFGEFVENDDFCDDLQRGRDETRTSACSGVADSLIEFRCGTSNSTRIPLSRVGDGVCDCCDGSDEVRDSCPDICAKQQMDAKMKALSWHRFVQTGARKRQEMVNSMRRKKTREVKNLETLRQDFANVRKVSLDLRYWLRYEESKESKKHFELLRERELRCISGLDLYCDYWQPRYFSQDEMWIENAPDGYMASTRNRVSKPKSRRETDYRASLSALERVRSTTCDAPDIMPDENLKIHVTVGEYLAFQSTPGGEAMRKRGPQQHRKDTLFVKFLEGGPNGPVHGLLAVGEVLSMVLLPVSLPVYGVYYAVEALWEYAWQAVETCAESRGSRSRSGNSDHSAGASDNSSSSVVLPAVLSQMCLLANQTRVPGTVPFEVLQLLDYTSYSFPMRIMDNYISPALQGPYLVARLMWRAPIMYMDYYFLWRYLDLPPSRHCCLLRTAINNAHSEMERLKDRIKEENDLLLSLAEAEAELGGAAQMDGEDMLMEAEANARIADEEFLDPEKKVNVFDYFMRKNAQKRHAAESRQKKREREKKARKRAIIDYGDGGDYEALKNLCVSREVHGVRWEVCFYKTVTADSSLVGMWSSWGPLSVLPADYDALGDGDNDNPGGGNNLNPASNNEIYINPSEGPARGLRSALSWLGGIAGAMRGVQVDRVQQEFAEKRLSTPGYWQHQSYVEGASCNGTDLAAAAVAREELQQAEMERQQRLAHKRRGLGAAGAGGDFSSDSDHALFDSLPDDIDDAIPDPSNTNGDDEDDKHDEDDGEFAVTSAGVVRKSEIKNKGEHEALAAAQAKGLKRNAEVRLTCGHDTAIADVSTDGTNPCTSVLTVTCPMACDSRAEQLSLQQLDTLGVFGFSKRSAAETVERHLEATEGKKREASKRLTEQQQRKGDVQKTKEEEALKAAALERRKKALGKMASSGLKKLEEEQEQAVKMGEREKQEPQRERKRKAKTKAKSKGKSKKKKKKKEKKGGGETVGDSSEGLKMDVIEGVDPFEAAGHGKGDGREEEEEIINVLGEADLFDSLPDDDYDDADDTVEVGVDGGPSTSTVNKQKRDPVTSTVRGDFDPEDQEKTLKLIGGMARPIDLPLPG